jgi:cell division protein FtsI/penicillin-binding protein 2
MAVKGQRTITGLALIGLVSCILLGAIGRIAYIQTHMREELLAYAEQRWRSEVKLPGRRGAILDRHGRLLAGSHEAPTLFADPKLIQEPEKLAFDLAMLVGESPQTLAEQLSRTDTRYVVLLKGATEDQVDRIRELREQGQAGLGVVMESTRVYPMGQVAAHVTGFVGTEGRGLGGVEMMCDEQLRGQSGRRIVYRDVRRRAVFQEDESYIPPENGLNVILSIDAAIQQVLERQLAERCEHHAAESAVGLVMDPRTGELLAMANHPTFHPTRAGQVSSDTRRNRNLTDPVEPGSIFKPFIMAAALEAGVTHPHERINCHQGWHYFGGRRLHDHHPLGVLTVEEIMIRSSNIGMAQLGERLGNKAMHQALRKFGFGEPTGIDLPGEGLGLLMPLKAWNSYSTTSVPMGQELAVTPIQMLTGFNALINGGILMEPRVVLGVADPDGDLIEDHREPVVRGQALDPEISRTIREILSKVVSHERGTGRKCDLEDWQVMGKTGTAQVPRTDRRGYDGYLASFIAAAPAHDPAVAVLVMVRKPSRNGYYGGLVALPAVKAVLEFALPYLGVPPDRDVLPPDNADGQGDDKLVSTR